MAKYLIEVPHSEKKEDCEMAVRIFLTTGSHFLTNADWGCLDGEHKAWFIMNADSREQARSILPPAFQAHAKITMLNKFSLDPENGLIKHHDSRNTASHS
jgi:hypothetical protein